MLMTEAEERLNQRLRPLRVPEYEALAAMGAFKDQKVELIRGRVVWMAPQGEDHAWAIEVLVRQLMDVFGHVANVRPQLPLRASDDSLPEPDFALTPLRTKKGPHPTTAYLLIEVAQSSLRDDRVVKAPLYAEGVAPEYWIVNVQERQLEVFRTPKDGQYTEHFVLGPRDTIRPVAFPDLEFPLAPLLGEGSDEQH
jgi:Uma2 family endonuclease